MYSFFFFNDTATTEIYTLSLHDALPISCGSCSVGCPRRSLANDEPSRKWRGGLTRAQSRIVGTKSTLLVRRSTDRKSTRLNSSHSQISYAVFCLKKKKNTR